MKVLPAITKKLFLLLLTMMGSLSIFASPIHLLSPDKKLKVVITTDERLHYMVFADNHKLIQKSPIGLVLRNITLGNRPKLLKKKYFSVNTALYPEIPLKNSKVIDHYNGLRLDFKGNFSVEFRAYNDGIAYRFITNLPDTIEIKEEIVEYHFASNLNTIWSETNSYKSDYQIIYKEKTLSDTENMSTLPVLLEDTQYKLLISEADLFDYPCMFLKSTGELALKGAFAKVPLAFGPDGDRSVKIIKEADYIAKTKGTRNFPWRFAIITKHDEQLIANEMVFKLSRPNEIKNPKWIKPGQVTWEWWHNAYVYGVDFKSGYNQKTYEYYIDFASKNGIPYIIMDEGWAKTTMNPYEPNPTINLHELIAYGKQKNVKIILWFTWLAIEENFDVFKTLHDWGIAGVKIDFMDRSDQWMVNYYTRVAKEAAKHHIIVDFHGAYKPAGLRRAYPNVLTYEGVVGMEGNILGGVATPDNNVYLPFIRNAVGPMDYTPGAMRSAQPKDYKGNWVNTMSIGTRAHQLSMYVVFESGLQMLADNPYNYMREPEALSFITSVPVTWDETRVLDAKVGEYILIARRKGESWFVGGMNNSKARELILNTDFLDKEKSYKITIIKDGVNADVQAMDFKQIVDKVSAGEKIEVKMEANGGFVARIELN